MTIGGRYYSRYHPNRDIKTFWSAAERRELLVKECELCGICIHPSRLCCPKCLSTKLAWRRSSGVGSVYSFSVIHYPYIAELKDKVPYVLLLVMLDEGVLFYSVLSGADPSKVKIGMRVRAVYDNQNLLGITMPKFTPLTD